MNQTPTTPAEWERARGLRLLDQICLVLLVRSSVEEVAGAMAEDAAAWERDVLGREVVVRPESFLVFRLRGHAWSVVLQSPWTGSGYGKIGYEWERVLSRRIRAPMIEYGTSDTCGTIGYTLFEDGEIVEDFFAEDHGSRPAPEGSRFSSTRRSVKLDRIENIFEFVEQFFLDQDAFEPGIEFAYFFGNDLPRLGEPAVIENPGFVEIHLSGGRRVQSTPGIERVDYLVQKPAEDGGVPDHQARRSVRWEVRP